MAYGRTRKCTEALRDTKGVVGLLNHGIRGKHGKVFRVRLRRCLRLFVFSPAGNPKGLQCFSVSREAGFSVFSGSETIVGKAEG